MKAVDWEDVDFYPAFAECEIYSEKNEVRNCFEQVLQQHVSSLIGSKNMSTHRALRDTVWIAFSIDSKGAISILDMKMDSLLDQQLPSLRPWLTESIETLPKLSPASKQGVPVTTQFTFPVVIETEQL